MQCQPFITTEMYADRLIFACPQHDTKEPIMDVSSPHIMSFHVTLEQFADLVMLHREKYYGPKIMDEGEMMIVELTPETIPDFARKTGRDEQDLLEKYHEAKEKGKALFGMFLPAPVWIDEVMEEE